ncbi:MAG: YjbH domain-containing protein, partial [Proteobacteria bacterium]|nr:YjbH domain-containing protein [Pseudomonadota bacterium]
LQGFTGLLNTPNAGVTDEGKAYILFSNQKESQWRERVPREENYIFSIGLFSFAEIGGRLTEAPGVKRDLSANAKVRLPLSSIGYFLPDIAFGMQDMGGGARNLQTKYVVATKELWRLRVSAGYGTGPDRMDGVFGGIEFRTFDWLYLIAEHDTKEKNIGIRLVTPAMFDLPVNLQATAKTSFDYRFGHTEFGIGLQFPLGADYLKKRAHGSEGTGSQPPQPERKQEEGGTPSGQDDSDGGQQRLRERLVAGGFLNVRVGADREKGLLVIEYENSRYNHNELDGLGVVAGLAVDTVSPDFEVIRMITLKKGIRVLQVSALISDFREFLHDTRKSSRLYGSLIVTPEASDDRSVRFIDGDANPSRLKSELAVYPGLKTYVGTEVGVFDYLLSVKPDYYLNLWRGAVANARFDIPVSWSENFKDRKVFRNRRESSQADRLMLFQSIRMTPRVMLNLGAGMILHDTYG